MRLRYVNWGSKERQHPTVEACIMFEFLKDTFIGSMPLDPTDRLFRSPSGLFFECRGIARAVPVKIDKIEVCLDFHIYSIVDFDLLLGSPLENLLQEKSSQGSLSYESRETSPISYTENPMAEHHDDHNLSEETMLMSPFISPNTASSPDPLNDALLKEDIREELSNRIIDFSEVVWIKSPSTTIPCSIQGITIEAQLIPNMEGNSMSWHLAHSLLGSVSLKPSGKLLKSCPEGHILEC